MAIIYSLDLLYLGKLKLQTFFFFFKQKYKIKKYFFKCESHFCFAYTSLGIPSLV